MKKPSSKAKDIYFRVLKLLIMKNSNIASLNNQSQALHKKYSNMLAHGLRRTQPHCSSSLLIHIF